MPINMKPPGPGSKPTGKVVRNTEKNTVLSNLVRDRSGRSSSTDAGVPRPEQELMNESLQVPHPFEKGKTLGWGEFKGLAKTQASKFRDMGITDMAGYQQKLYDDALAKLQKFPEAAVDKYQDTRVAERTRHNIQGVVKKPSARVVAGGEAVYQKGTQGIKMRKKKC